MAPLRMFSHDPRCRNAAASPTDNSTCDGDVRSLEASKPASARTSAKDDSELAVRLFVRLGSNGERKVGVRDSVRARSWRDECCFLTKVVLFFNIRIHVHSYACVCIHMHFIVFLCIQTCCILQIGCIRTHFTTTLSCCIVPMGDGCILMHFHTCCILDMLHFDAF